MNNSGKTGWGYKWFLVPGCWFLVVVGYGYCV